MVTQGWRAVKDRAVNSGAENPVVDETDGPKAYGQGQETGLNRTRNGAQRYGVAQLDIVDLGPAGPVDAMGQNGPRIGVSFATVPGLFGQAQSMRRAGLTGFGAEAYVATAHGRPSGSRTMGAPMIFTGTFKSRTICDDGSC